MKIQLLSSIAASLIFFTSTGYSKGAYSFKVKTITGKEVDLAAYRGKVSLIVNTASQCGYTPQYAGLEQIYEKYKDKGFNVLGFPSNDFGAQEPGNDQEIAKFCDLRFKVKFPLFAKVAVTGASQVPLYKYLTSESPFEKGTAVRWNFEKFLIDPQGKIVGRYKSSVEPTATELTAAIETQLKHTSK